jgi:hypothetical protein
MMIIEMEQLYCSQVLTLAYIANLTTLTVRVSPQKSRISCRSFFVMFIDMRHIHYNACSMY